jgi:hypothetical protein
VYGGWWLYKNIYPFGTGTFPDFPTLGQDRDAIYVGFNRFTTPGNTFVHAVMLIFPKSRVFAGQATSYWYQFGFQAAGQFVDTLQPANVQNIADNPRAEFAVNSYNINFGGGQCFYGCRGLVVWAISNPVGFVSGGPSPVFSGVAIGGTGTYYLALGAHQPSCDYCIDNGDTRISGSVTYQSGSLYASVTTAVLGTSPENSGVYIWEIGRLSLTDNGGGCTGAYLNKCATINNAEILQEYRLGTGGWSDIGGGAYYATALPDPEKNLVLVYNYSSKTYTPGTALLSRRVNFASNTLHDSGYCLMGGCGIANYAVSPPRWGDYTGVAIDNPAQLTVNFWVSGMYSAGKSWNTRIARTSYGNSKEP